MMRIDMETNNLLFCLNTEDQLMSGVCKRQVTIYQVLSLYKI